jgi:anti-anti-sigma factor
VLDLRQLTFMDSTGLHLLLRLDADARSHGRSFSIIETDGAVARLLTIAGRRDRFQHATPDLAPAL